MSISPEFSVVSIVLSLALVAYLVVGEPLSGRRLYGRLVRRRASDSRALTRFYLLIIVTGWASALLVVLILLASPGIEPKDLGIALPVLGIDFSASVVAGAVVGLAICCAGFVLLRRFLPDRTPKPANLEHVKAMLPKTVGERRLAALVSFTAGITEELVCRGFLIAFGVGVLGLNISMAAVLSVLVFGFAHLYQGIRGMASVTLTGVVLTAFYLAHGSLLIPIVLHVLIDLNSLLWIPRSIEKRAASSGA